MVLEQSFFEMLKSGSFGESWCGSLGALLIKIRGTQSRVCSAMRFRPMIGAQEAFPLLSLYGQSKCNCQANGHGYAPLSGR